MTDKVELPLNTDAAIIQETQTSDWLHQLKEESWEAELLVSAIAIFGTFQLFDAVAWVTNLFIDVIPSEQYLIGYMIVFIGLLAVSILSAMFIIHFILRAYWVGLVGLNSVFPDYSIKDSPHSQLYTEKILSILPKLKESIAKVDQLCSVIFSAAFSILFIYIYSFFFFSLYLFLYNFLLAYIPKTFLLIPLAIFAFIVVIHTILSVVANIKVFQTNNRIQIFYFKIVKISSLITMGPLYKNILQVFLIFGTNFKKNKGLVKLIILFGCIGAFVAVFQMSKSNIFYLLTSNTYFDENSIYANYYHSENLKDTRFTFLLTPEIPSDILTVRTFKLFIPIFRHERRLHEQHCDISEGGLFPSKAERVSIREQYSNCYALYHQVLLNGIDLKASFMKYEHPITRQFGLVAYVQLQQADYGKNSLTIRKKFVDADPIQQWDIPFHFAYSD
jgi:hypothetical protein